MANIFKNNAAQQSFSERQLLEAKYQNCRHNLLLVVIFSLINSITLLMNSYTYFLFSAWIPYDLILTGKYLCGKLPEEYYEGLDGVQFYDESILVVLSVISFICIGLYLLCWLLSKKKVGWMITALVFMSIDTLVLLSAGISMDSLFDYLFHGFVIYYLISGIIAHNKLKNLPEEDVILEAADFVVTPAETVETVEETVVTEAAQSEETPSEENADK